jgi:hypothetical protein
VACDRPNAGTGNELKAGRFIIMKKQSDHQRNSNVAIRLWTHEGAVKAVPYLRAVIRSLREQWLRLQFLRREIQRLDSRSGRPDRQARVSRAVALQELDRVEIELDETFDELNAINVACLDPIRGLALIPFGKPKQLAWYVFDVFAPRGLESWRFDDDPPELRRPLGQNVGGVSPAQSA